MPKRRNTQSRPKALYRVENWSACIAPQVQVNTDKTLVERGSITFWLLDDFEKTWVYAGEKQRGSQFDYTDQAILTMLTVKEVFHLTNRGVEGFVRSLFRMLKIDLSVPDRSTLSKRGKELQVNLPKKTSQSLNIVMDSTGLKIHDEGEWKVRIHGVSKRRTWRKLHIGVNPQDGEIQAVILTKSKVSDNQAVEELLGQIEQTIISTSRKSLNMVNLVRTKETSAHVQAHPARFPEQFVLGKC